MYFSTPILHGFILLLIFSAVLAAQKRDDSGMPSNANLSQNFAFEQITIAHDLPHNTVRCTFLKESVK